MIVAEPEAAFLFCMYQAAHAECHDIRSGIFKAGDKYMVVISEGKSNFIFITHLFYFFKMHQYLSYYRTCLNVFL